MIGARVGLRVAPQVLADHARPIALARCPGVVARLDEQVIAPESLLATLVAQNEKRVLSASPAQIQIELGATRLVKTVQLTNPATGREIEPRAAARRARRRARER